MTIGNVSQIYTQKDLAAVAAYYDNTAINHGKSVETSTKQNEIKENSLSTKVTLSEEALKKLGEEKDAKITEKASSSGSGELSSNEQNQIAELKSRDQEVRNHEMAHMMVGGSLVRKGVSYQYQTGPDGQRYAVSGEVSIDSSPVQGDPSATIRKMQQVKRAALAPANPSSQDHAVAASAAQAEAAARMELLQQKTASE